MGQNLADKIDQLRAEIGEVREMLAEMPKRDEIVTRDVYASDKVGFDQRLRALEERPVNVRANVSSYGSFGVNLALAVIALAALFVSLASHVSLH